MIAEDLACRAPGVILHVIGRHLERRPIFGRDTAHYHRFAGRRSLFPFPETWATRCGRPTDRRPAQKVCHDAAFVKHKSARRAPATSDTARLCNV
jgi:hypothetical protein